MYWTVEVTLILSLALLCVRSHVIWETPGELHPVHGLYVQPSIDGTTGDLYVAATEENGSKSEWLTDQPVNFLPPAAAMLQPTSVSSSLTKASPQEDKTTTQKRAIITSPAVKYAFALPIAGAERNVGSCPFAIPASPPESSIPPCSNDMPTQMAQPYPFQYYYPQMISAIASAINAYKGSKDSEEKTPIAAPASYWPQVYGYPYQYIFIDPKTWAQSQTNAYANAPLEAQNSSSNETA